MADRLGGAGLVADCVAMTDYRDEERDTDRISDYQKPRPQAEPDWSSLRPLDFIFLVVFGVAALLFVIVVLRA